MEKLLKKLGLDENAAQQILSKYNDDVSAAQTKGSDTLAAMKEEIDGYKNDISEKDTAYNELEGKYNDAAAKLKAAIYREFLFDSGINSEFVRSALARELEEKGYDIDDEKGLGEAKSFLESFKKDNPTLFGTDKKPYVKTPETGGGDVSGGDGVSEAFFELNPGLK